MEVASMLAAEPFTDEPQCVCPVIAEFLRTYNDQVDDARRQDLFGCAALVVDTRGDHREERQRANHCLEWWIAQSAPRRPQLKRMLWMLPPASAARDIEIAHRTARWAAADARRHRGALALVEALAGRRLLGADAVAADPAGADARVRADAQVGAEPAGADPQVGADAVSADAVGADARVGELAVL